MGLKSCKVNILVECIKKKFAYFVSDRHECTRIHHKSHVYPNSSI